MDKEKISFIEAKRLVKTIEKEAEKGDAAPKTGMQAELKGVTNPIKAGLLNFSLSKHKFNLKDI